MREVKRTKQKLGNERAMAVFIFDFLGIIHQKMASIKLDMELIFKMDANLTVRTPGTDIITPNHEGNHHARSIATTKIP